MQVVITGIKNNVVYFLIYQFQFRMSVLLAREEEAKRSDEKAVASSPLLYNHNGFSTEKLSKVCT